MESPDSPSSKRRPIPAPVEIQSHTVSRNSGLHASLTTFGAGDRFATHKKVVGRGRDSPNGREFYAHSPLQKLKWEIGNEFTQGIGGRKKLNDTSVPDKVGPGSYNIVASAAKARSPLDGPEYCSTSLGRKLPSSLVPVDMCSPGPHHTYEIRKPLDHHRPSYGKPSLAYGYRAPFPEDNDGPGISYSHSETKGMRRTAPTNLDGSKRSVRSTFGCAQRFTASKQTSSPWGDMYYAHSKLLDSEDYMSMNRTCGFGGGSRTDFSNIFKGHKTEVSPVTYRPVASTAKKTSAFDGLIERLESPTTAYLRSTKSSQRSPSAPGKMLSR